jgi:CRP/FNR family cyclic AMP-dependent transcriptional regulator
MKRLEIGEAEYKSLAHAAGRVDFFAAFTGAQLEPLLSRIRLYAYEPGEVVFNKGGPADAFYIIHEGRVAVVFNSRWFWFVRKITILGPGNFFGEMALLDDRPRSATVVVREAATLFVLLKQDFDAVVRQNPAFAEHIRWISAQRKFEKPR